MKMPIYRAFGSVKKLIRIISVLNAYYRHITKIMRIMCVLKARRSTAQRLDRHCPFQQKSSTGAVAPAELLSISAE